jgi:isochorismate synthase
MAQERTRVRHERILDAALEVFSARGYRDASVDDVASAAETSKGGVYFHFPGKDALFMALLERSAKLLLSKIEESVASEPDPVAKVDAALLSLLRTFASHRRLARLFLVETMGAGPRFQARVVEVHRQFEQFIRRNLQEAVRQGIVPALDADVASQAWFGALNQVVTRWVLEERPGRLEDAYPGLRALLLRSVGVDPRRSAGGPRTAVELLRAGGERARAAGAARLVSWTTRGETAAPLAFLSAGRALDLTQSYFERPDEGFALAGLGEAWCDQARFGGAEPAWRELVAQGVVEADLAGAGPTLLGGFAFDPTRPATALWRGFPAARLVLPRYLLTRRGDAGWLTVSVLVGPDADAESEARRVEEELTRLRISPAGVGPIDGPVDTEDVLPAAEWKALVAEATGAIRAGAFEKVVLARAVRASLREAIRPEAVVAGLRAGYPTCAVFAFQSGDGWFVGATPERLVRLRDGLVEVSSLAGTSRRGETPEEDERLGAELLGDPKNRHEHAVVARILLSALDGEVEGIDAPSEPALLKVRNLQHLYTPIRGRLAAGASLLGVAERLHPTPAVGGNPSPPALEFLRQRERLDRGWYASPVGWIDRNGEGEMVVALRSALLRGSEATLFAGCGIVADSQPESEWAESLLKLRPVLGALGA